MKEVAVFNTITKVAILDGQVGLNLYLEDGSIVKIRGKNLVYKLEPRQTYADNWSEKTSQLSRKLEQDREEGYIYND